MSFHCWTRKGERSRRLLRLAHEGSFTIHRPEHGHGAGDGDCGGRRGPGAPPANGGAGETGLTLGFASQRPTYHLRTALVVLGLWCAIFAVYRLTDRNLTIVDVEAVMRLPICLWRHGNLDLDDYRSTIPGTVLAVHGGRLVSKFPFWPTFQLLPAYLLHALGNGFPDESNVWVAQRRAAQLSMATTVLLVGMLVAHRHGRLVGVAVGIAFGFGSINWFVLSQLSFSNGLVQLWVGVALCCGCWHALPSRALATTSLLAMVVASFYRLSLLPVLGVLAVYLAYRLRRSAVLPLTAALGLFAVMAPANQAYVGEPFGLYGRIAGRQPLLSPTLGQALYGNLLSPSRGLLVFSPWVCFALVGLVKARRSERPLLWTLFVGCSLHLLVSSSYGHWFGGGSLGPRLTADVLPLWAVLAAAGFAAAVSRPAVWLVVTASIAASVVVAGGHALVSRASWTENPVPLSLATSDRLFDWRDAEVLSPFRRSPYEERYPIRLRQPEHRSTSSAPQIEFAWDLPAKGDGAVVLDLAVNPGTRGAGWTKLRFHAPLRSRVAVAIRDLPGRHHPGSPVAWRVVVEDDRGRPEATSGWRLLSWVRPQAEAVFNDSFESGNAAGWGLALTPRGGPKPRGASP